MAKITRLGLGGKAGHGEQGISWIHEEDMNRIFIEAIENVEMKGAYIASAPQPVANHKFMSELRAVLGVKIGLPAYAWMVRIGAPIFMNTDPDLALAGRYVVPKRLMDEGFVFSYPNIEEAFKSLFEK